MDMSEALYGAEYYSSHCGTVPYERSAHWLNFFGRVADELIRGLQPRTVFDAGCAHGFLVESLWDRGVEAFGRDISSFAISKVRSDISANCQVGSITEPFPGTYDLVTCIEVLEHLPEEAALEAIDRISEATSTILFSSSPTDLTEPTHINVRPTIYWLNRFAERGFAPDFLFDASFLAPHAMVLKRAEVPPEAAVLQLFAQYIRLKMALVEREQRIGRLGEERDALKKQRQSELQELQSRVAGEIRGLNGVHTIDLTKQVAARIAEIDQLVKALDLVPLQHAPASTNQMDFATWREHRTVTPSELILQRRMSGSLSCTPKFSILVPVYRTQVDWMDELIRSVRSQSYENWELCFAFGDPGSVDLLECIQKHATQDPRIKVKVLDSNGGIARNSNAALDLASGDWAVLLDHDDTLAHNALFELARALNDDPMVTLLYSDKDQVDVTGQQHLMPLFKPQWSPDIMLNANYLTHITAMRIDRLREIGGWDPDTDGAQDWDIFLRVIGREGKVKHIPRILYHWRQAPTSVASGGLAVKPYAAKGQLQTLAKYLPEAGWPGATPDLDGSDIHINWSSQWQPSVTLIVLSEGEISTEIKHLGARSAFQVIPVMIDARGRELDEAIARATGEVIVIVDADAVPRSDSVFEELIGPLQNPAIALVGGKSIDQVGRLIDFGRIFERGIARPFLRGQPRAYFGMFGSATWYRNALAAPATCLAFRKALWNSIGPFSSAEPGTQPDLAFCLRATLGGYGRLLLNPFAEFSTQKPGVFERLYSAESRFGSVVAKYPNGDPYFHSALEMSASGEIQFPTNKAVAAFHDYAAEARMFAESFTFDREDVRRSIDGVAASEAGPLRSMAWFVPDFDNPFYGGLHTIFRVADFALRERGIEQNFVVVGGDRPEKYAACIGRAFPALADKAKIHITRSLDEVPPLESVDAAIATLWITALPVLRLAAARRKFYFLQDWEPLFYPAGTLSAMVEATYRFGFRAICNTVSLANSYREFGGHANHFVPATDPRVFHARRPERLPTDPVTIFCYARPGHPRNCFEVLIAALRDIKHEYGDKVDIVTAGAEWDPAQYGLVGTIRHLGLLSYEETGVLYRAVDIGLVAMSTRHPSYLPFELMACGAHVVTNRNNYTSWLLRDGENCSLFEVVRGDIVASLRKAIDDEDYRVTTALQGATLVKEQYSDWGRTCAKVCDLLAQAEFI
ncbi:rhamnosyltransferase WsaF family glycosyltransferase [Burkholderia sp. USMB20]|uniref:rhamnosyltransferase WsaF family glycosyltransferase n=1 Tax=Burkholderia sp. USMB20 TaxID=1571773 RepID=UPI0009E60DB4|nr:glycosyltransferase [Burkholderia sp. USMB20]TGN94601.1 glycosyltransferase [Burkholderia sp. USMB20]